MQVSIKQIYQAYPSCHKGKSKAYQAQQYDAMRVDNIFDTYSVLHTNTYQPKPYTCFVADNGLKPREIYTANFYDRVVHHYLVSNLEKIISYKFIYHSCAHQVGKGSHFGVSALQKMMRKLWKGDFNRLTTTRKGDFNRLTAPAKHPTGAVKTALPKTTSTTNIRKGDFNRLTAPAKHSTSAVKTALPKATSTLTKLQTNAQSYVFISEQGYVHNRLKQRKVRQLFIANHPEESYV